MDKSSFFFTANCGVCHPGGAAMQYDRNGALYFNRSTSLFGYGGGVASLPVAAQLDGDYGFINPANGVPGTANWPKTGVSEADCLMCHMTQNATGPGTPTHDNGLSWHKRAATLRGTGVAGVANFEWAPTAGAGWATVAYVAGASPPQASAVTINYGLGLTAGTLVNDGGFLAIPLGKIAGVKDANCRGCHSIPDGKKSGRTLLPTTDVHIANGVSCVRCHPSSLDGGHQIGKGDITIGSVRNDLDGTVKNCDDCHLDGADPLAPDPTASHRQIPGFHFGFMKCQSCHVRHLDDDPVSPTQDIPELVIEMTSNGTQNVSIWSAYLGTNPLDPSQNLPELAGRPFRWYPTVRWYKGRLQTVKPLYTAWFGEWLGGAGDGAMIRPIPLRLVRRAISANGYPASSASAPNPRQATLPLTPGSRVASGAPILHRKDEIRATLIALRDAVDTANTTTPNDIVVRPVLVRAEKVYYLNASDEVEYFESAVGESHDFAVNHNVVVRRDPANPVLTPGPYGSGGCNDCHGPNSTFFYTKQLVEPAQYDYLDEAGTVPNPAAGQPRYATHYEAMGYSSTRAGELTGTLVPVLVTVQGGFGSVAFTDGTHSGTCRLRDGGCKVGMNPGATVTFTATAEPGATFTGFSGCTTTGATTCSIALGIPTSGLGNQGALVRAAFTDPPSPPPPVQNVLITTISGGQGTVAEQPGGAGAIDCRSNAGLCGREVLPVGSTVTLTASPWAGSAFAWWSGCSSVSGTTCTVTVTRNTVVHAEFVPTSYPVSVRLEGGKGYVTGGGFNCWDNSATCAVAAAPGTTVTMTAYASAGSTFQSWLGCTRTTGATCEVDVTGGVQVRARYTTP